MMNLYISPEGHLICSLGDYCTEYLIVGVENNDFLVYEIITSYKYLLTRQMYGVN